jgi:hypothetical protein
MTFIWTISFWGALLYFLSKYILSTQSIEIPLHIDKPVMLYFFFTLWSYALYKVIKTKGVFKKLWVFLLSLVFSALAGWLMFFYDNYAVNSDIKSE